MGFWIFMLIMDLLIPFTMIGFGKMFLKKAPGSDQLCVWLQNINVNEESGQPGYLHIIIAERSGISVDLFFWWYL